MQDLFANADFLICLAVETTASYNNLRRLFATPTDRLSLLTGGARQETAPAITDLDAFLAANSTVIPRVVHLDWCVCSVKDFKVLESAHAFVNPGNDLDETTMQQTKLTQEMINNHGVSFTEALEKLMKSIETITGGNGKYRVCSFGDWPVKYQLALEALRVGTRLPQSINDNFINLLELHYEQNPAGPIASSLEEMLLAYELNPNDAETKCKTDGASLVRILNRMIRSYKTRVEGHSLTVNNNESTEESKISIKQDRTRSRSRERQDPLIHAAASSGAGGPKSLGDVQFAGTDMVALKMRGLPWRVEVDEIEQFFSRYAYIRESIRVGELTDGRKTGQAALLFENPDEANNAMNEKQGQNVGSRWVELYQMPYSQYQSFQDDQLQQKTVNLKSFLNEENLSRCVKLRGIPYQATVQDVKDFFGAFNVADDDVVIEMRQGKKTGFALVFLSCEDDVQRARQELNKQYIGSRFIDVMVPRLED